MLLWGTVVRTDIWSIEWCSDSPLQFHLQHFFLHWTQFYIISWTTVQFTHIATVSFCFSWVIKCAGLEWIAISISWDASCIFPNFKLQFFCHFEASVWVFFTLFLFIRLHKKAWVVLMGLAFLFLRLDVQTGSPNFVLFHICLNTLSHYPPFWTISSWLMHLMHIWVPEPMGLLDWQFRSVCSSSHEHLNQSKFLLPGLCRAKCFRCVVAGWFLLPVHLSLFFKKPETQTGRSADLHTPRHPGITMLLFLASFCTFPFVLLLQRCFSNVFRLRITFPTWYSGTT